MTWTKVTRAEETTGGTTGGFLEQGFLSGSGFLTEGTVAAGWTDQSKASDSWTDQSHPTDTWTDVTKAT
jgi:hypothetical protein